MCLPLSYNFNWMVSFLELLARFELVTSSLPKISSLFCAVADCCSLSPDALVLQKVSGLHIISERQNKPPVTGGRTAGIYRYHAKSSDINRYHPQSESGKKTGSRHNR